jgi:hypothetical protein
MATYKPLQSVALTSDTASVTFSGIDQGYTDLVIVSNCKNTTGATYGLLLQYNGDTTSNYSTTLLWGTGSAAVSFRYTTSYNAVFTGWAGSTNFSPIIINIQNYANTTTFKTTLSRSSDSGDRVAATASLWRKTPEAITSINISFEPTANIAAGSTFSLYGIKSGAPQALGGDTVVTDGTYWYHTFRSTQTFTPLKPLAVDYLVVAGGGAGGPNIGGGGGAGGLRAFTSQSLTTNIPYTVTVGGGGTAAAYPAGGGNGVNSSFNSTPVTGGGGGGTFGTTYGPFNGGSGGGSRDSYTVGTGNAGGYSPVEGYAGGKGNQNFTSGGGGGSSAVGNTAGGSTSGAGGAGASIYNSIDFSTWLTATSTGSSGKLAAGGGGGAYTSNGTSAGAGGTGGGGAGTSNVTNATSGTANTGSGGGGGSPDNGAAGNGGSGIVIVRYPV